MKKFVLVFMVFLTVSLFGQEINANLAERVELDVKGENGYVYNFEVIPLKEKGLINVYSMKGEERGSTKWVFQKRNVDLAEIAKEEVIISKKFIFYSSYVTTNHFHAIFRGVKNGRKDYKVVSLELATMELEMVEGELPTKKLTFDKMIVLGDYAIIDTKAKKETFLTLINWQTGRTKVVPIEVKGANSKRVYFQNFQVLEDESEVFAFVTAKAENKTDTYVITIDRRGNKKDFFCLTEDYENVISDISVSKVEENEYIYTGTYSKKNSTYSNGLFIGKSIGSSVKFIESYNFLKLNNFLSYLPQRKQNKVERKKKRKEKKGKELNYSYLIACHDIIKKGDKYILLGEAFYPTYRSEARTDANGVTTYREVFDGYQYTHAVIVGFDKEGGLIWDNSFKMFPSRKPFYVKKFISISEDNDRQLKMVFSAGRSIHFKSIDNFNGKTLDEKQSELITTGVDGDKLSNSSSETEYWYGRNFITYGYQKVKNKSGNKKRKRKVYYINKIEY